MRMLMCLTVCFLLLSTVTAHAENSFGVFDLQRVVTECDAMKDASSSMEKKFGTQRAALEKEKADIEQKAAGFQKKPPTQKQQTDLQKQHREYQEKTQAFLRLLQADEMRVRKEIDDLITTSSAELASQKGFVLLLDKAAVPYVSPTIDVTEEMLTTLNSAWKKKK